MEKFTEATILKGKTRELVRRHSSVIIPLLTVKERSTSGVESEIVGPSEQTKNDKVNKVAKRPKRKAAIVSARLTKKHLNDN